jgi:C-methyltransferase C-terminal domain/Putative zinc binding domain/Methyltransferase domain
VNGADAIATAPTPPRSGADLVARGGECRFCGHALSHVFADLGATPLANAYLTPEELGNAERSYPLRAFVCDECLLVQLEEHERPEAIFSEYPYFSSFSSIWLEHARRFAEQAIERFGLDQRSRVVEVASNDGYLLQYFHSRQIPVLGIEPAANVAKVAIERGIPTLVEFFGVSTARALADRWKADLLVGNNVLAHVPDLNDFVGGLKIVLSPEGVLTMEFPHLMRLIDEHQFDTIYHEHFSYFSFSTARRIFDHHGIELVDVEELPTHGGSLRIYGRPVEAGEPQSARAEELLERERAAGLDRLDAYLDFSERVEEAKRDLLAFLISLKRDGLRIVGYGAPAKASTLLNYCGIGTDFIDFTVDVSPHKQGHYLPGTRIPIAPPEAIRDARPDVVLILPWNLMDEIVQKHAYIREWGGRFAIGTPTPRFL